MEENSEKNTTSGKIVGETNDSAIVKEENNIVNIDKWIAGREEFLAKVASAMKETKDFHIIQGKKSLAKGGAEKIASIFQWSASFVQDDETYTMFGKTPGLIVYKCILTQRGEFVGEGRGASTVQKNLGDPNKTIKMAQKSAYIDAVIRTSGLSDIFTQDLEDMNVHNITPPMKTPTQPPGIPNATNQESKMYVVFKNLIGACKNKEDLNKVAKEIENVKKTGVFKPNEIEMLRGIFRGKDATL